MISRPLEEPSKVEIRRVVRNRIRAVPPALRREADARISLHLAREASRHPSVLWVLGYVSLMDEPRVDEALCGFVAEGRAVYLPQTIRGRPGAARWRPCSPMRRDEHGVLVPAGPGHEGLPDGPGLILVPGRAFDREGRRVGRGGGWYDRLLAIAGESVVSVGVGYECQQFDAVPSLPHDRAVAKRISENGLLDGPPKTERREGTSGRNGMTRGDDR